MQKTIILCTVAAILGGFVAVLLFSGHPAIDSQMIAQEPRAGAPLPVQNGAPVSVPPALVNPTVPLTEAVLHGLSPEERVNVTVYQSVNRCVVNINTKSVQTDRFMRFEVPTEGEGSGSVLDREGHILTNFHVVDGAKEIQVTLFDSRNYQARLIGVDPDTDIAVLKSKRRPNPYTPCNSAIPRTCSSVCGYWPSATPSGWNAH